MSGVRTTVGGSRAFFVNQRAPKRNSPPLDDPGGMRTMKGWACYGFPLVIESWPATVEFGPLMSFPFAMRAFQANSYEGGPIANTHSDRG